MITLKKWEMKEAHAVAEALLDLVNDNFCDIAGECDHRIVGRLVCPDSDDDEIFADEFERQVYKHLVKRLGG
jgi:hypothetical protein